MLNLGLSLSLGSANPASGGATNTATLTTTSGASKNSAIIVTGSPALNGATDNSGVVEMVRSNQSASGKRWFEAKVTQLPAVGKSFIIGVEAGTATLGPSTSTVPGINDSTGVVLSIFPAGGANGWDISKGGSFGGAGSSATPNVALNDVIRVEFDTTPGGASDTVSFFLNGTQLGTTVTGLGTITTAAFAVFGSDGGQLSWASNFGQNAPAFTPTAGFVGYGS
jgi:hypothetical protein